MPLRTMMIAALAVTSFLFVACKPQAQTIPVTVNGTVLHVEIAKTPKERQLGLMYRKSMADTHGMLFIFPTDRHLSFWMKNTDIPLSIAYIASDGTIKEIYHMKPHSLEAITSDHSVRYALELNQGEFARLGVKPGDRVIFPKDLPVATK